MKNNGVGGQARAETPQFNVIDLFAGVGGLTLGFLDASAEPSCRFTPRLMVDNDREIRPIALQNFPTVPYLTADIGRLSGSDLRTRAGLRPDEPVHVLMGGPPCQGFSWLGKRALDDPRNVYLMDFLRAVREIRPLVAVIENVPLVVTSHDGAIIKEVCDGLGVMGYAACADILQASDYGVPQLRKRAFVIAYRGDLGLAPQLPRRTHERVAMASELLRDSARRRFEPEKLPYVSVEDAIGDLPPLQAGQGEEVMPYSLPAQSEYQRWARAGSIAIFNHRSRTHSAKFLDKIAVIAEGGRNTELPDDLRFSDNYYSQAYARLHRHGIAQTITTYFGNPGSGRFTHYRDLRALTVREAARLQSFPDVFVFDGPHSTQMRAVGNAVPSLMARALRDQIARDLLAAEAHKPRQRGRPKTRRRDESSEERSRIMRAVPGKNTSAELKLRKALWEAGLRGYRLHSKRAPGNPDVLFPVGRVVVFVDGCFWHGCPTCYRAPKSNTEYWSMKVRRNKDRDARVTHECEAAGWRVVRLWEHEVARQVDKAVQRIGRALSPSKRKSARAAVKSKAPPAISTRPLGRKKR